MHTMRSRCRFALLALALGCVTPPEPGKGLSPTTTDWRDEVIYQVLIDRFENGDASNDWNVDLRDPAAYHGGDWRGLANRLDYLAELGVTALWISPVVKNVETDAGFASYHGYWTQDFTRPNPHFGDVAALRELTDAAHARGMKVILDIVTNHVGQAFYYDINRNGRPDEFLIGQGGRIVPLDQATPSSDLVRISEWDPDYSEDGIESWTSLGRAGEAPVRFLDEPAISRVAPFPEIFAQPYAYNRKGRVTVWTNPGVCGCPASGCPYDDPCRRRQEVLGDFPGGLKDLATERADVRDALYAVFARWIELGDFDGFRIDTLKHVEPDFWNDFCPRIRRHAAELGKKDFFMFGEAFDGDDRLLGAYTEGQGVDSVFYFSAYYQMFRGAFLGDGSRTCELARLHCRRVGCAADPCEEGQDFTRPLYAQTGKEGGPSGDGAPLGSHQLVVNFESNHDVGRFLFFMPEAWTPEQKRKTLHLGLAYLMTTDGLPSLYYGVEQEFAGGNDPANRETLWDPEAYKKAVVTAEGVPMRAERTYDSDGDGSDDRRWLPFDTGNPTFRLIKDLIALRKAHVALRRGSFKTRWSTRTNVAMRPADLGLWAFERAHAEETVLVVLSLAPDGSSRTTAPDGYTMAVAWPAGTTLVDLRDPGYSVTTTADGCRPGAGESCVTVEVAPRSLRVLAPG